MYNQPLCCPSQQRLQTDTGEQLNVLASAFPIRTTICVMLLVSHADMLCRMELKLSMDIKTLRGPLCVWLPPPPGDRMWFSFLEPPQLQVTASPLVNMSCFSCRRPLVPAALQSPATCPCMLQAQALQTVIATNCSLLYPAVQPRCLCVQRLWKLSSKGIQRLPQYCKDCLLSPIVLTQEQCCGLPSLQHI